jgi:hypothetical protein
MDARRLFPWLVRLCWVILPFTVGPAMGAALHPYSGPVRVTAAVLAWAAWAAVFVGTLVPYPIGLTALRSAAPAAAVVAVTAALTGRPSVLDATLAVGSTLLAVVVAFTPATGVLYVNGPAYPNERRYPLRPPGPLLLGPLQLVWAVTVGAPVIGILLLAGGAWVAGGVVLGLGSPAAYVMSQALHRLSRRWVVFVPAGLVIHDPLTLAQPVLFQRQDIEGLGPAAADSTALDLTMNAPGLALELVLRAETELQLVQRGHAQAGTVSVDRVLITPTRPGQVLAEASGRRIPVSRDLRPPARPG